MAADQLPEDPIEGEAHIISQAPDSSLTEHLGQIGVFISGRWVWFSPLPGWVVWDKIGATLRVFDGMDWVPPISDMDPENMPFLGLNASAGPSQRLSVASDTSLFTHDGDSHRLTLNRAASADTASLVFQTDFSGEAEIGLTGGEGLSIKTSSDGMQFDNRLTTPANYAGVRSPAFGSQRITIANNAAQMITTPAFGGLVALTVISDSGFPQVRHSGIFAYDIGKSPNLVTLAKTTRVENHGTIVLVGSTSLDGNIGVSAVEGGLYIENRMESVWDFSLTFLC